MSRDRSTAIFIFFIATARAIVIGADLQWLFGDLDGDRFKSLLEVEKILWLIWLDANDELKTMSVTNH